MEKPVIIDELDRFKSHHFSTASIPPQDDIDYFKTNNGRQIHFTSPIKKGFQYATK